MWHYLFLLDVDMEDVNVFVICGLDAYGLLVSIGCKYADLVDMISRELSIDMRRLMTTLPSSTWSWSAGIVEWVHMHCGLKPSKWWSFDVPNAEYITWNAFTQTRRFEYYRNSESYFCHVSNAWRVYFRAWYTICWTGWRWEWKNIRDVEQIGDKNTIEKEIFRDKISPHNSLCCSLNSRLRVDMRSYL